MTANSRTASSGMATPTNESGPSTRKRRQRVPGQQGSVRQLPTGRWQARLPSRLGGSSVGTFATRSEANRTLARSIVQSEEGLPYLAPGSSRTHGTGPTVAEVVRTYIEESEERLAHHTSRCYRSAYTTRIEPSSLKIGLVHVNRLTTPDVATWRNDLLSAGHSHYSVRYAVALLSAAYGDAAGKFHLPINPVTALPRQSRTKRTGARRAEVAARRAAVPSWGAMASVLAAIPATSDRLMVLLLAWGGTRFTEAASLKRLGGVSATTSSVSIERVVVRGIGNWVEESPKTGERREVRLPVLLGDAIRAHVASLRPARGERWDVAFPAHGRSARYRGGPGLWTPTSWNRVVWQEALAAAGLQRMPVKRLRAHAATVLCASGASVLDAQAHLGHATLSTTQAHYLVAARAISEDPAIADLRSTPFLTLQARLDLLWDRYIAQHGDPLRRAS